MASRSSAKAARLAALIREHEWCRISDPEFEVVRSALAPVSESHLRRLLRASGLPLDPLIEGVVQDDFETLERSLRALEQEYSAGDRERARRARAAVITARQHAIWAVRRSADPSRAAAKEEMILWMLTWLENPPLFPAWIELRKRQPACLPPRPEI